MATPAQTSAQAQDTDERALRKVFSKLVEGMKATDVIDELYECNLLRREEYEGILDACSKEDSKTLNRRVLMAISRRPPGFDAKLAEIFRKKHSYLADALEEALAQVSSQPRTNPAPTPDPSRDVHPASSGSTVTSGPMSKWNVDALVALKGKLKLNVKMIALANILETPAGGFMNSAEAQSVRDKTGDAQQIEQVIDILRGKGDKEFATFCQMLHKSNYQVWAHELEEEAEKFKTSGALPGTDPAPLRGNPQAVMSTSAPAPGPSKEGGVPSQQSTNSTTHPFSPTLNNMCWPEFPALQDEFSTLVSKLSETVHKLEQPQFDSLLVYLRERLRPMVDGCLPTEASPNIPDDPTPSELVRHLQKCHYWNYLNTDLVEGIIRHVSREGSPLASLMAEYKENFRNKVTQTLEECRRKNVKPEPPPHYTTIAVEIDPGGNPLSFHLHQILRLRNLLVQTFGVNDVLVAGFTVGSIVLYFYIPEEAMYSLCPKLEANCTALEELHVTTLVVFGHFSVDVGYQQMSLLHKSASEDPEPVDEVPMDAQSPGGADETGFTENPPKDPPKAEMLNPVQKLMMYSQSVDQHKETDNALDMIKIVCRENEEKEEANIKLSSENAALMAKLEVMRQENQSQAEKLQHLEREVYEMKIELESARRKCHDLTEEKRERDRRVAEQSEDLIANQNHIEELNERLKEADGESKRIAFVLSRKHALELELKDKDALLKEAVNDYEVQLEISGSLTAKASALEEENTRLRLNLEVVNKQLSAVFSKRESLKHELHNQSAKEERLQLLLRERDKEIFEWKHAWDAQNQHLQAALATSNPSQSSFQPSQIGGQFAVTTPVGQAGQGVGQHARYDFRPRKTQETTAATGVFPMELSSVHEEAPCPASHPQIPPQIPPTAFPEFLLPTNCPRPSTIMLSLYAGRMAPKWYEVAHALGIGTEADGLLQSEHSTERKCLQCLQAWIDRGPEVDCSWEKLLCVLNMLQLHAVAQEIQGELWRRAFTNTL